MLLAIVVEPIAGATVALLVALLVIGVRALMSPMALPPLPSHDQEAIRGARRSYARFAGVLLAEAAVLAVLSAV